MGRSDMLDVPVSTAGVRILPGHLVLLSALTLVAWMVPASVFFICAGLGLYALLGARQSVEALILMSLLILMSWGDISLGRWFVLFGATARTVWDSVVQSSSSPPLVRIVIIFTLSVVALSMLGSYLLLVSILKIVSVAAGVLAMVISFHRTAHLRDYWLSWFLTLGVFIIFASLPLYFSSLGYRKNARGFQGILNHPQTFGPILAPMAALLTGLVMFHGARSRVVIAAAVLVWYWIYVSQARTGMLAALLGLAVVLIVGLMKGGNWSRLIRDRLSRMSTIVGGCILVAFAAFNWTAVDQTARGFLVKDYRPMGSEVEDTSVSAALESSRSALMARSMSNFRKAPLTGIGLGVPSDLNPSMRMQMGALGLPQGASVEKGFMGTALLEEIGLVGTSLFVILLVTLLVPVVRFRSPLLMWVMVASLLVNTGEAILLSIGGNGFFHWLILTFCYVYARSSNVGGADALTASSLVHESLDQRGVGQYGRGRHLPAEYPPVVASRRA